MMTLALAAAVLALPERTALVEVIRARDGEFFHIYFDKCEPEKIAAMTTADLEMYHDRAGVVARSAEAFVVDCRKSSTEKLHPDA